jgi:hypothetical protein
MLPTTIGELYVGGLDRPFGTMKVNKVINKVFNLPTLSHQKSKQMRIGIVVVLDD